MALPSKMVIKSPNPKPGITFRILVSSLTRSPNAFESPSYWVTPMVYPTNPPVLLFTFFTSALTTSMPENSTCPSTRPAMAPVAKAVGSFFRASRTSPRVLPKSIFTCPKVRMKVKPLNTPPSSLPRVLVSVLTRVEG